MRILYHHRTRAEDAQGIHIDALCRAFEGLGHQVRLVGPGGTTRAPMEANGRAARRDGATLFGARIPAWLYEILAIGYNIPAFVTLCAYMIRQRPQLVYERYALYSVAGRLAAALFRVPFVLEVNAPLSLEMRKHGGLVFATLAQRVEDWLVRRATRSIVVSRSLGRIYEKRGIPIDRLMVIPNGVDRAEFNCDVDGTEIRRRHGLTDRFVIGFVGWIRPWHGVDLLLEAFAKFRERIPEAMVLLVGDGPAVPALEAQSARLGIPDRVQFAGSVPRSEVPAYIAAMDVAVQPDATNYASPIKLFEYLAMGKPVVAPRRANILEVVSEGETALLFRPGDADELAERLIQLHDDLDLRRCLARAAVGAIETRGYHWDANARRVLESLTA